MWKWELGKTIETDKNQDELTVKQTLTFRILKTNRNCINSNMRVECGSLRSEISSNLWIRGFVRL